MAQMQGQGKPGVSGSSSTTGTPDTVYNLVSILYHCLEGADTYEKYIQDADRTGDTDLAQFFRDVKQDQIKCADRCKDLLMKYLGQSGTMGMRRAA